MKPTRKTKTLIIEYWDCGSEHCHKTERVAIACMEKTALKAARAPKKQLSDEDVHNLIIDVCAGKGMSLTRVARKYGITLGRTRAYISKYALSFDSAEATELLKTPNIGMVSAARELYKRHSTGTNT